MFRIHFDPSTGMFLIQVLSYGLFWRTVRHVVPTTDGLDAVMPMEFGKYQQAVDHVNSIGLSELYRDRSHPRYRDHVYAA